MDRGEAEAVIDAALAIEKVLDTVPHGVAIKILRATKEIQEIVGWGMFPGGYYGKCIGCEEPKGEDEMRSAGDEDLCVDCLKRAVKAQVGEVAEA